MNDPTDADILREVIGIAESLLGFINSWNKRMPIRPDDVVSERSRRMLVARLARAAELLGPNDDMSDFIGEVSRLDIPLPIIDAPEQVEQILISLCNAYHISPRSLKPRRDISPLKGESSSVNPITARVQSEMRVEKQQSGTAAPAE